MKKIILLVCIICSSVSARAQYSPQAGLPGSIAISASSGLISGWATQCLIFRGFKDIANPSLGHASAGDSSLAIGPADNQTVSLGDSGVADLTFEFPIYNGDGADFAVFENGFVNTSNDSQAFLELGFVEVSSDGLNYFRFPANSLTQNKVQINNDNYIYANDLNNLAGSFTALNGTPFDLQELSGISGLDVNKVTHVRVIDVVGSISGHSSLDSAGRIINDPYPTPFASCGFDLDAVGVLHQTGRAGISKITGNFEVHTFPNPVTDRLSVSMTGMAPGGLSGSITDIEGKTIMSCSLSQNSTEIEVSQLPRGMYLFVLKDAAGTQWIEKVTKL
jgi:hypothetical protein